MSHHTVEANVLNAVDINLSTESKFHRGIVDWPLDRPDGFVGRRPIFEGLLWPRGCIAGRQRDLKRCWRIRMDHPANE